ncbi:MAG: hypothetical protein AAF236_07740 [Verrucomicrobiota bacterium]
MENELKTLADVVARFESSGIDYMLTGSVAMNYYAQPRMTNDIDMVVSFHLKDAQLIESILGPGFYVSEEAAREAVVSQSSFNAIDQTNLTKIDFMIRKREEYRLLEFERRRRVDLRGVHVWIVSKEDLIISKLDWARDSISERQLSDVENLIASGCDEDYLRKWSAKLRLTDMLTRVFP